jgi:outer membrane usher protein FimD/PapC
MKTSRTISVILIGLFLIALPFVSPQLYVEPEELVKISGTLTNTPEYHQPTKGDSYSTLYLDEYSNREFNFHVSFYSVSSLNQNNFFEVIKKGDKVALTVSRKEYESKINNLQYPKKWQFINVYVNVYGIEAHNKHYTSFKDYNSSYKTDKNIGYLFPIAGILFILGYFYWEKRKAANKT